MVVSTEPFFNIRYPSFKTDASELSLNRMLQESETGNCISEMLIVLIRKKRWKI